MSKKAKSGMKDEQFDEAKDKVTDESLPKAKPVVHMSFHGGDISSAHKIMREVAKAAMAPPKTQKPKQDKKVSKPGSKQQKKDFKKSSGPNSDAAHESKESAKEEKMEHETGKEAQD